MVSFLKKKAVATSAPKKAPVDDEDEEDQTSSTASADEDDDDYAPPPKKAVAPKKGAKAAWLMAGAVAKAKVKQHEVQAEARREQASHMREFWLSEDEEHRITFLDGDLDDDGLLDCNVFEEHKLKVGARFQNYVCTMEAEKWCPICNIGDSPNRIVGVLTIIDHTPYTVQNGQNAGKVLKNRRMLYKAPQSVLKKLTKLAGKKGGLRGLTVDVSRSEKKAARCGDTFDPVEKWDDFDAFMAKFKLKPEDIEPAVYADEITYYSPEELLDQGIGKANVGPGYSKAKKSTAELADEM